VNRFAPWQQAVLDRALAALAEGRMGHALLLVGPSQLGKLEVAQALAQRLLCSNPDANSNLACGRCRSCQLFAAETHGDFKHVTFEPNEKGDKLRTEISVEQIRKLGQWFSLTPQLGGVQVALIQPADALNIASANALLKTLEEPAPNRFLLMVTSRPGRLPATIRSRCQRLEFRLPNRELALDWLEAKAHPRDRAIPALDAALGHPGLAEQWLNQGGLALREQVRVDLNAIAEGRASPVELAQAWLGDEQAELRLRFSADLALEAAETRVGAVAAGRGGLKAPADFSRLSDWFDAVNRTRDQLRAPLRHDLVVAGLLLQWRSMFQ
jgi:DNA polymerase-3 subunit delta'